MTRILSAILVYFSLWSITFTQTFTDSNLPIIVINTDNGVPIRDDPRVLATMKIIYRGPGERNYLTDQNNPAYLNYNGRIDIEIRGSSSQATDKKQYGFTTRMADNVTNNNVSLLGMPKENDWILNGMVWDPGLIRDYLSYNLSRQIGEYATRTAYCEVVINGSYKGLYVLQEKIKADDNRVDIMKIGKNDNLFPQVTGGYITKADKTTGGDPVAWTMRSWFDTPVEYIHDLPKPENVTPQQNEYIRNRFLLLESTAFGNNSSPADGFPSVIDIPSFIDYIIINELSSNADAYQFSTFFHKDRNGKLRAGPIWDLDLTFGNDLFIWGYNRSKTNIWQLSNGENDGSRFWKDLFNNPVFRCYLSKRWNELIRPGQPLNQERISSFIDQTVAQISEAVARDYALWGITGSFQQNISAMKTFVAARINWMTANLGSYGGCANVPVPPLVITKIMYHPPDSPGIWENDDLEFIEITNNSDQTVDLTGIYFSGTGFVFSFPPHSTIAPRSSVYIAGKISAFNSQYGFTPFGQFSRNLSDKGERLTLVDAFGNLIDVVEYADSIPWPDADGNGKYLQLADANLDNNDPVNWFASEDIFTSDPGINETLKPVVFPNPVRDILRVQSGYIMQTVTIFDMYGRMVSSEYINATDHLIDVSGLSPGLYIIRIDLFDKVYTGKFIRY